jgi:hypothetical protein
MDVVGHQAVGVEGHRVSCPIQGQPVEVGLIVAVAEEYCFSAIAPGDDVVEEPRTEHAWRPTHTLLAETMPVPRA